MKKGWWSHVGLLERHIWQGDQILLATVRTRYTVPQHRTIVLDAGALGLRPGGWLESAVNSVPNPMQYVNAVHVARFVTKLALNSKHHALLEKPVARLTVNDVLVVFDGVDELMADVEKDSRFQYAQSVRRFLSAPTIAITSGDLIRDVRFKSALRRRAPVPRNALSDRPHPGLEDSELAKPAAALEFNDIEDLRTKQISHFNGRNSVLREICNTFLDSHDLAVEAIQAARKCGITEIKLPNNVYSRLIRNKGLLYPINIPTEAMLPVCVHLLDSHEMQKTLRGPALPEREIEAFAPLRSSPGYREQFGILLSEHYLSKFVLMACLILLMLETKWNASTVINLTPDRIEEIDGKYHLYGYKSKSGQNQQAETSSTSKLDIPHLSIEETQSSRGLVSAISKEENDNHIEVESPDAARAIKMLLQHRANIDKHWATQTRQLFLFMSLSMKKGEPPFRTPVLSLVLKDFCKLSNHPFFQLEDIRKQTISTKFLVTRDLRQAQVDAGHANPGTTLAYVSGAALRHSKEAVMKDFGEILSASYLYVSGRLIVNPDSNDRKSRLIKNLLLFPPSSLHAEDGDSIADRWLSSGGHFAFEIGEDEITHCIYQKKYYKTYSAKLVFENPKRFKKYHLPRILFCEALYRFIAASPLGTRLKEVEEKSQ